MTTSNDTVEAVARAICHTDGNDYDGEDWDAHSYYRNMATAAIQALIDSEWPHETSPEMLTEAAKMIRYSRTKSVVVGTAKAILKSLVTSPTGARP